jgi:general stress protein 26
MEPTREPASGAGTKEHERFFELARSFDTAMLVTHRSDGTSHARPMALAEISDQGDMWFVTREHTPKVDEVKQDERTLIVAQESGKYLTVTGQAEVQRDARKLQALWSEKWRPWFGDKDDPELVLLRVHPLEGEYWDTSGVQGLKYVAKAATAYVTGKKLETSESDPNVHGKVPLS